MNQRPIGVFDSGLGGLTAVRQLRQLLPAEDIIYFGDTSRVPYGNRRRETILDYARQDMRFLSTFDLKAVVVACGTVSSNCLLELRAESPIPVIGVVEPAAAKASDATRSRRVGVAATYASVRSGAYERAFHEIHGGISVFSRACPLFVPLVEEGRCHPGDPVVDVVVEDHLKAFREAGIDTLVLGCTHYPLLREAIAQVMGPEVTLVDAGAAAAEALQDLLTAEDALAQRDFGTLRCFTSGQADAFQKLASMFLGEDDALQVQKVDIMGY